jgi:hypothetical protein
MAVQSADVIRLWSDRFVGPEVEFRGPAGVAVNTVMLRNISEPTLTVFRPTNGNPNGA